MFDSLEALRTGNDVQKGVYAAIIELDVIRKFAIYNPFVCGTFPINIYTLQSDVDIIMEVHDFEQFKIALIVFFGDKNQFRIKEKRIRGRKVIKANFSFQGFAFELFGQAQAVEEQYAYLHMVIEHRLLQQYPEKRENIIKLKSDGIKTEPAFCMAFEIEGDHPYEDLIFYGKGLG